MQEYPTVWKHYERADKLFQLKYIDRPRLVWRSYSLHLGVVNSFTLSVVGPSADLSQLVRI